MGRTPAAGSSVAGRAAFQTALPASEGWLAVRGTSAGDGPSLWCVHARVLRWVRLSATAWTVARQAPLSIGFPRHEYWNGVPCPSPGDLPDPGVEPVSCALAGRFFTSLSPPGLQRPPTNFIPKGWLQGLYFFKSEKKDYSCDLTSRKGFL